MLCLMPIYLVFITGKKQSRIFKSFSDAATTDDATSAHKIATNE